MPFVVDSERVKVPGTYHWHDRLHFFSRDRSPKLVRIQVVTHFCSPCTLGILNQFLQLEQEQLVFDLLRVTRWCARLRIRISNDVANAGVLFFFVLSYSHEAYLDYGGVHF